MMRLLLLRHAKAAPAAPGGDDLARPLVSRGEADAAALGRRLRDEGCAPDLVLCSPARRARETASALAPAARIQIVPELYLAEIEEIFSIIGHFGAVAETVMVVGHNPGLECCARLLAGGAAVDHFSTCTLAEFEVSADAWEELTPASCALTRTLRP